MPDTLQIPVDRPEPSRGRPDGAPTLDLAALVADPPGRPGGPMTLPPSENRAATADGVAQWHDDRRVTALWSNAAARNAYASVPGLGWKRLVHSDDSAFLAMVAMASHAEATGAPVRLKLGSGGEIEEIYVW